MTTIVHSNGSKWAGQEPDSVETLLSVLNKHTLDRRFGSFWTRSKIGDRWAKPGMVRFFGNFIDLSHVFSIDTDEPELIERITKAICRNRQKPEYRKQPKPKR